MTNCIFYIFQFAKSMKSYFPKIDSVVFFPLLYIPTAGLVASAESVVARLRRLGMPAVLSRELPWQAIHPQVEVDEFFHCLIAFSCHPQLQSLYDWWIELEQAYLLKKLKTHRISLVQICKAFNIESLNQQQDFRVPWITENCQGKRGLAQLIFKVIYPFQTLDRGRLFCRERFPAVAPPAIVDPILAFIQGEQAGILARHARLL